MASNCIIAHYEKFSQPFCNVVIPKNNWEDHQCTAKVMIVEEQ